MVDLFIPLIIVFVLFYALIKGFDAYSGFVEGAKGALPLMAGLLPYMIAMFIAVELFRNSGLSEYLCGFLSPLFKTSCQSDLQHSFDSLSYLLFTQLFDIFPLELRVEIYAHH